MRHSLKLVVPAIASSALLAACGSSSYSSPAKSSAASPGVAKSGAGAGGIVKTAPSSSLGKTVLVNAEGLTLYSLSAERAGKFICTSNSCEGIWHPLTVKAGTTPTGAVGSLSVIKRPDGVTQVTYQGMPLYTFAQDHAAGETHGQGVKDVGTWSAVTATSGSSTAAPPSSSSAGESGGAKYAY